jgi:transmembrane sensor
MTEADLLKNELFVKWVRCPDRELNEYWHRWIAEDPSRIEIVNRAIDLLHSFKLTESPEMPAGDYTAILDALIQYNQIAKSGTSGNFSASRQRGRFKWLAAASISLLAAVVVGIILKSGDQVPQRVARHEETQATPLKAGYIRKTVSKGEQATVLLPDGSLVKLNACSEIEYPQTFSETLREVWLIGQAFFEVKKNKNAPFIVHTKDFSTNVLGTSFDVRAYDGDKMKHVAVLTGKVNVRTLNGQSKMLVPDQMTIYDNHGKMSFKDKFSHDKVLGWQEGIIEFEDTDFSDVLTHLSRSYGVEFKLADGLKIEGKYTGKFRKQKLDNVLLGIAYSHDFQYSIQGNEVFIYK